MTTSIAAPSTAELEVQVTAVIAAQLGLPAKDVEVDRPLSLYGLDSISSMEALAALEDATGRRLPEWLLLEHPTVRTIVAAIEANDTPASPTTQMRDDAILPDDVRVPADAVVVDPPRHVLLTGATGFLGAYLLRTLIDDTAATVSCLVRAGAGEGLARVRANLERYGLWRADDARRLEIVRGDLSQPRLGLGPIAYDGLAATVDAIYHAAAEVDWVQSYGALRATNVGGTLELIRLACTTRPKTLHFISSASVCYVPGETHAIREEDDCLPWLERLPLGYAQTKCVAEALVRQASARGLPARVFRPGLVAGDAATGASNTDDLIARLVKGCIEMGLAPDLAWTFEAVPVDHVARAVVRLPDPHGPVHQSFHLVPGRPRTWQECVLWMNLNGYVCGLAPYSEWRDRLARDGSDPTHALHGLRRFFLDRDAAGAATAEIYAEGRHASVDGARTAHLEQSRELTPPAITATVLGRYFDDYAARGFLPRARTDARDRGRSTDTPSAWQSAASIQGHLRAHFNDSSLRVSRVDVAPLATGSSIIGELTAWRRGTPTGLFTCKVAYSRRGEPLTLDLIAKTKASDDDAIEVGEALARLCSPRLADVVREHREAIGLRHSHVREVGLYRTAPEPLRRHMPACYASWRRDDERDWGVLIERLDGMALMDAADDPARWRSAHVDAAIDDLATIHAAGLACVDDRRAMPWLAPRRSAADMRAMTPLWVALAEHAAPQFGAWAGHEMVARHGQLAATAGVWWSAIDAAPMTLVHQDCNPRNIALAHDEATGFRLVAYDWELAGFGAPQRDLAEWLCFVLPPHVEPRVVVRAVERHRVAFERASGVKVAATDWQAGFSAALAHVLVDRLAFYAMIQRVRPQSFLPRVLRTWQRLDAVTAAKAPIAKTPRRGR